MRTVHRFGRGLLALIIAGSLLHNVSANRSGPSPRFVRAMQDASMHRGTTTRLADGRWFVIAQDVNGQPAATAMVTDPRSGGAGRAVALAIPRAGHTATTLPDGTVLVFGGTGGAGQVLAAAELFDPTGMTFVPLSVEGAAPRAGHTATLLTDGRVLVAGGIGADGEPIAAEIWDLTTFRATALAGALPRIGHDATLLPDGRVLLTGGRDAEGEGRRDAEAFDPFSARFVPAMEAGDDRSAPIVTESRPVDAAVDVSPDVRIAVRFSKALSIDSLLGDRVRLDGPDGAVTSRVVPAEGGRLLFVTPDQPLATDATYWLSIRGAVDTGGVPLAMTPITFQTKASPASTSEPDTEEWRSEGGDWRTHRPESPWQKLPPLQAPAGVTAIAGQVLRLDGRPLVGVTLEVGPFETESDQTGRFLLQMPGTSSGRVELEIKGSTANRGTRTYGFFEYGLPVTGGQTTVLPFTMWMPRLDTAHQVTIPVPTTSETVVTTPYIPGLELHLPAGTRIRGEDGNVVNTLSITAIPVDRPPFPLPRNVEVPIYFTIQPGGAYVSTPGPGPRGAWLVYPNYKQDWAGKRMQFFHYDPKARDWYVYGLGTVTADRRQVVPDPRTRIYEFTGAMINGGSSPPADGAPPGDCCRTGGDPVDLGLGLFTLEETDVTLPDVLPIALTRTYRSRDLEVRAFGVGTTHPYAMFLWSAHQYTEADLILPDGGRVHYIRTSPGTEYWTAVFEHVERPNPPPGEVATSATPTAFYRSVMRWNGNGWDLTLKDGTVYVFGENAPLQAIRDRYGNTVTIAHQYGQTGAITRITSPHGRWIAFTYTNGVVTQVKDNSGRTWSYLYDANQNLWKVTDPLSGVIEFTYTSDHNMEFLSVTNP